MPVTDKEDMEEVWRQSWITIDVEVKIPQNSPLGLTMKEVCSYVTQGVGIRKVLRMIQKSFVRLGPL